MLLPDLPIVAEGEGTRGERWFLKAGGSSEDCYCVMETVHHDGQRDEGGMGGPALYPGHPLNVYTGELTGTLSVLLSAPTREYTGCAFNRNWVNGVKCSPAGVILLSV